MCLGEDLRFIVVLPDEPEGEKDKQNDRL